MGTRSVTDLVSEHQLSCLDGDCGHIFIVVHQVTRSIRPSRRPRASVLLPVQPSTGLVPPPHQLPIPANDHMVAAEA